MASPAQGGPAPYQPKGNELISRGVYRSNPLGSATFVGLRALDPILQYQILAHGWGSALIAKLGLVTVPLAAGSSSLANLPLPRQILLAMATGSAVKQIYWLLCLCKEEFPPGAAITVSIYNTLVNTLNSLLLVTAATSAAALLPAVRIPGLGESVSLPVALGAAMYAAGLVAETVAEKQRRAFKDDAANKGKVCTTGLWGLARHANYAGYTLWRTGYSLAAGGWGAAAFMASWHGWTFCMRSIPMLDRYMAWRYDGQWMQYKADVPYALFPGIY